MKHNKLLFFFSVFYFVVCNISAQTEQKSYFETFIDIRSMLSENDTLNFTKAIYLIENVYCNDGINKDTFDDVIHAYSFLCREIILSGNIEYLERDKDIALAQCAVFTFMTDSIPISINEEIVTHSPFEYNYDDFLGKEDWSNMFVSKLMETKKGNCHSMPYLYKMIMDELGYECHLALAPNHMYIKANNKKVGWYNIELTCGDFPTDAWYAASGYIHTDAIRNGIYMRALSDKEAVAMTLVDLAQGYHAKFGMDDGSFIIKCCDTALEHFPNYINAMLLKAEILTALYKRAESDQKQDLLSKMNELYTTIHKLGYRKMPQEMYANWMNSLGVEDRNQKVKGILNPNTK